MRKHVQKLDEITLKKNKRGEEMGSSIKKTQNLTILAVCIAMFLPAARAFACDGGVLCESAQGAQTNVGGSELNVKPDRTIVQNIGQWLAGKGIYLNASYFSESTDNLTGGEKQGADYADQTSWGADVDLQQLMDWQGGELHVEFTNREGHNHASDLVNNSAKDQQIYGNESYFIRVLTLEQKLYDDRVDIVVGSSQLDPFILQDPIYCHFQNESICGHPDITGADVDLGQVLAAQVTFKPVGNWYLQTGITDYDPQNNDNQNHGFDVGASKNIGFLLPEELGYQTTFDNDKFPRRYDVGVVFDRTPYTYAQYNSTTHNLGSGASYGRTLIYLQGKQMVYRPDTASQRGLTVFAGAGFGPGRYQQADYNIVGGGVWQGPFASRPLDSAGLAVSFLHYRGYFIDQLYDYRVNALNGNARPNSSMTMVELDYDAFLTRWLDVMPEFQYIIHPDGLGGHLPYPNRNLPDAFMIALQFNINIGSLIGLPAWPGDVHRAAKGGPSLRPDIGQFNGNSG